MAAFEKILSGIPQMDTAFDNIRLGDNVVWQVSTLEEFRTFALPFAKQAAADGRDLIYVRFASHPPILEPMPGLDIRYVKLSNQFEKFTVEIHRLIEKEGKDAFYIFDCLSELQTAWSTDLMMGNFFRLTCPYLFSLDTVAYFPILRGRHSYDALAQITDTTQLLIDVYSEGSEYFVRPLKVWKRYSSTMFLLHRYQPATGEFSAVSGGVDISRFYQLMDRNSHSQVDQNADYWTRFFNRAILLYQNGFDISEQCAQMCDMMLTRDPKLRKLILENFRPEDFFAIRSRMIGTGLIGGKASGMLLARSLVRNRRPDLYARIEPHDSFYIGSDVFYSYIVDNGLWPLRIRQRTEEGYFSLADEFSEGIQKGSFRPAIREKFRHMLEYYGQDPYIVRSSSILEDSFGNAFAGKYKSVFCRNRGTPDERLAELEYAVKTVYASTTNLSALDYRLRRGLEKRDEQMSLLIQRVSGSRYRNFFMPAAAGVGYSVSPYNPAGSSGGSMLRLVMGLGTAAVDRKEGIYPRIVTPDAPQKAQQITEERRRYSQQKVDAIDLSADAPSWPADIVRSYPVAQLVGELPEFLRRTLLTHDRETEAMFRERGERRDIYTVTCDGAVQNAGLMRDMADILQLLQKAYDYPVDTEFTMNFSESGDYRIGLLQCRPLQVPSGTGVQVEIPQDLPENSRILETVGSSMGMSAKIPIDIIVSVDPVRYYEMPYRDKYEVRSALSQVNWYYRDAGKNLFLFAPGRICTSSPELGIPSVFADISTFRAIAEVAETKAGYMPELSFGSHIFQDLVEAGILYTAVFRNEKTPVYQPEIFEQYQDLFPTVCRNADRAAGILRVYDMSGSGCTLYYNMMDSRLLLALGGS